MGISKNLLFAISNIILKKNNLSIEAIKSEIITILKKRNKKILIIIDDIDRLNKREIRKIMRLIKVNADFPNTIYLLAFDNQVVEQCLNIDNSISGKDYLSKIVNVNFDVPMDEKFNITDDTRIVTALPTIRQILASGGAVIILTHLGRPTGTPT